MQPRIALGVCLLSLIKITVAITASYDAVRAGTELVYCLIASPDGIGCCGQVYHVDHALMAQHGELIEISADAFQLMKDWFEFLDLVDCLSERRDAQVFAVSHAGLSGDALLCKADG